MSEREVLLPGYFDPVRDAAAWEDVLARAGTLRAVVLNPGSGPGPQAQAVYAQLAQRLRATGAQVLGYVDTAYGARDPRDVESEIRAFRAWYGVDGVFLDQSPADIAGLDACERHVRDARALGCRAVVLNPGVHPHPAYAALANILVTFDGPASEHERLRVPSWVRDLPASRFCHLVYDVAPDVVVETHRRVERCHAGTSVLTDGSGANPWGRPPSWWRAARAVA